MRELCRLGVLTNEAFGKHGERLIIIFIANWGLAAGIANSQRHCSLHAPRAKGLDDDEHQEPQNLQFTGPTNLNSDLNMDSDVEAVC